MSNVPIHDCKKVQKKSSWETATKTSWQEVIIRVGVSGYFVILLLWMNGLFISWQVSTVAVATSRVAVHYGETQKDAVCITWPLCLLRHKVSSKCVSICAWLCRMHSKLHQACAEKLFLQKRLFSFKFLIFPSPFSDTILPPKKKHIKTKEWKPSYRRMKCEIWNAFWTKMAFLATIPQVSTNNIGSNNTDSGSRRKSF